MPPPTCLFCGGEDDLIWREITGFDRPRGGGGTNHITLRVETGRAACRRCVSQRLSPDGPPMEGQEAIPFA